MNILTMAWDVIDSSGGYILSNERLKKCDNAVSHVIGDSEDAFRLIDTVESALHIILKIDETNKYNRPVIENLRRESEWAHQTYVRGYYLRLLEQFRKGKWISSRHLSPRPLDINCL
jgi:hypothetical protein